MTSKYVSFYSQRKDGFVYILRSAYGLYKVGASHDKDKRFRQHKSRNPSIVFIGYIPSERYMYLEKFLHYHLKKYSTQTREWFESDDEEKFLSEIIEFIKKHGEIFGAYDFIRF